MKNDIKQIKNELQEEKKGIKTQKQVKMHQERLKNNLYNLILEKLELDLNYLDILEKKHDLIIETIERTKKEEEPTEAMKHDFVAFDCLPYTDKKAIKEKEQGNEEQDIADYNFLFKEFFNIYNQIKREEIEKERLINSQEEEKILKVCINKLEFILNEYQKRTNQNKYEVITYLKYYEVKEQIIKEILTDFPEFNQDKLIKLYDKARKQIENKYKYTMKEESEEQEKEKVKLSLPWRLLIYGKAIKTVFKSIF